MKILSPNDRRKAVACAAGVISCVAVLFGSPDAPQCAISSVSSKEAYASGDTVIVALKVSVPPTYHLYGNPLGPGIGKPLTIGINGGNGIRWLDITKTKAKKYMPPVGGWVWAHEGDVYFFLRGIAGDAVQVQIHGKAIVDALICSDACYPRQYEVPFSVLIKEQTKKARHFALDAKLFSIYSNCTEIMPVMKEDTALSKGTDLLSGIDMGSGKNHEVPAWKYTPREEKPDYNLWMAMLFGFLAGIILNAMPCVLPVLGIKILSFTHGQHRGRKKAMLHSLVFSAGVISVFLFLAGCASFADYSWGSQFQNPKALTAIIALIVVFALGMFDVYSITVPASVANLDTKNHSGLWGDFFKGIFATILATPCSGPFLGAVLAWSVMQPPAIIFIVYSSIGAGMSFPYVLFSASERLAKYIPKPGRWMQDFKGLMGFLLIGFAVYLLLGLPDDMVESAVFFAVTVSIAVMIFSRYAPFGSSIRRKLVVFLAALSVAGGGYYLSFSIVYPAFSDKKAIEAEAESKVWQNFSADSLLKANAEGRSVIVDFTANWCMNCQYNYIMVLAKNDVLDLIRKKNVLALKADMTMPDPVQDSLLRSLGSQSIPFLAIFPGDTPGKPIIMRDVLTKRKVIRTLEQLR